MPPALATSVPLALYNFLALLLYPSTPNHQMVTDTDSNEEWNDSGDEPRDEEEEEIFAR
jgi:hypothetical protein